nr:MAG TPA: hypothetical protein [Caudoviricetes sp.]
MFYQNRNIFTPPESRLKVANIQTLHNALKIACTAF